MRVVCKHNLLSETDLIYGGNKNSPYGKYPSTLELLTIGKSYEVIHKSSFIKGDNIKISIRHDLGFNLSAYFLVKNDGGIYHRYPKSMFMSIEESRDYLINSLIK